MFSSVRECLTDAQTVGTLAIGWGMVTLTLTGFSLAIAATSSKIRSNVDYHNNFLTMNRGFGCPEPEASFWSHPEWDTDAVDYGDGYGLYNSTTYRKITDYCGSILPGPQSLISTLSSNCSTAFSMACEDFCLKNKSDNNCNEALIPAAIVCSIPLLLTVLGGLIYWAHKRYTQSPRLFSSAPVTHSSPNVNAAVENKDIELKVAQHPQSSSPQVLFQRATSSIVDQPINNNLSSSPRIHPLSMSNS